jgi:hypothetical protein
MYPNKEHYEVVEHTDELDLDQSEAPAPADFPPHSAEPAPPAPADASLSLAVRPHGPGGPKIALQVTDLDRGRLSALSELILRTLLK